MKYLLLLLTFTLVTFCYGQSVSNDFTRTDTVAKKIEGKEIRESLEVQGSIYHFDKSGKKIIGKENEERIWKFGREGNLLSNWKFDGVNGNFAIRHEWTINPDGSLTVHLQQFDTMKRKDGTSREIVTGKLLKEDTIQVVNLSQIQWTVLESSSEKMTVLLTPSLNLHYSELMDVTKLPVILKDPILSDSKGRVWGNAHSVEAAYVAFTTHLGQVALSYYPFAGAKQIGYANGNTISLELDNATTLTIKSANAMIGSEKRAKIYGILDLKKKSDRLTSVGVSASSEEKEFLAHLD